MSFFNTFLITERSDIIKENLEIIREIESKLDLKKFIYKIIIDTRRYQINIAEDSRKHMTLLLINLK